MSSLMWRERMHSLVVAGLAERTLTAYLRAVRMLSQYYNGTDPAHLTEQQVNDDLLWMRHENRAAPGTLKITIGGLEGKVLKRFRIPGEMQLPADSARDAPSAIPRRLSARGVFTLKYLSR